MSETLKDRITRHEGVVLKPYKDTMGKLTIGIGRNLDDVGITEDEAEYLLDNDISKVKLELTPYIWYAGLDNTRKDVLVEMAFQLGLAGVLKFNDMITALNKQDYEEAADQMLDSTWYKQTPNRCKELAELMRNG